jgi:hypothetical protein
MKENSAPVRTKLIDQILEQLYRDAGLRPPLGKERMNRIRRRCPSLIAPTVLLRPIRR